MIRPRRELGPVLATAFVLGLLPSGARAKPIAELEANWPAIQGGSPNSPKTMDVSFKSPCLVVMKVTLDPYTVPPVYGGVTWQNTSNTIPSIPHGKGISESRTWENGVLINRAPKKGSHYYTEIRFRLRDSGKPGGKVFLNPPKFHNQGGAFLYQVGQYAKVSFDVLPLDAEPAWGPPPPRRRGGPATRGPAAGDAVGGTTWNVKTFPQGAGAGVWKFLDDGTLLGLTHATQNPPAWKGTWTRRGGEILCRMKYQGKEAWFVVVPSGNSFEAYESNSSGKRGAKFRAGKKG